MARLSQSYRDTVTANILAELPALVDYDSQIRKRAQDIAAELIPPGLQALYADTFNRSYLASGTIYIFDRSVTVYGRDREVLKEHVLKDPEIHKLAEAEAADKGMRADLKKKIQVSLNTCTTVRQFQDRFPELAKFGPDEYALSRTLPATTSLMDALTAAGLKTGDA